MKKFTLILLRLIPFLIAVLFSCNELFIINFYWNKAILTTVILLSSIFLILLSKTFKFCIYHRISIYYFTFWCCILTWFNPFVSIYLASWQMMFMFITFVVLVAIIIAYLIYGDRNNE